MNRAQHEEDDISDVCGTGEGCPEREKDVASEGRATRGTEVLTLSWSGGSLSVTIGQGGYVATSPIWDAQNMTVDSEAADVQSIVINVT